MYRWNAIFKTFGNINKLKIVKLLSNRDQLPVGEIAQQIDISFKATSKHLNDLAKMGALLAKGKNNRVYYSLNPKMPADFRKTINLFIKQ